MNITPAVAQDILLLAQRRIAAGSTDEGWQNIIAALEDDVSQDLQKLSEGQELANELEARANGIQDIEYFDSPGNYFPEGIQSLLRRTARLLRSLPSVSPRSVDVQKALDEGRAVLDNLNSPQWRATYEAVKRILAALESVQTAQPGSEAQAEIEAFQQRLRDKHAPLQAVQLSLNERVREFVDAYCRNGSKTGRPNYRRFVSLFALEKLRAAFDEYQRFAPAPPQNTAQPKWQRIAQNLQAQVDYMTAEIANALSLHPQEPSGTVESVRQLMAYANQRDAEMAVQTAQPGSELGKAELSVLIGELRHRANAIQHVEYFDSPGNAFTESMVAFLRRAADTIGMLRARARSTDGAPPQNTAQPTEGMLDNG